MMYPYGLFSFPLQDEENTIIYLFLQEATFDIHAFGAPTLGTIVGKRNHANVSKVYQFHIHLSHHQVFAIT
jgi:hypothetical protein